MSFVIPAIKNLELFRKQLNAIFADLSPSFHAPISGTVSTTDATVTTISTVAVPTDAAMAISAVIAGRRTGGAAGSAGDSAGYVLNGAVKNIAGTVSIVAQSLTFAGEDQAGWTAALVVSGTDILIRVTGAVDNNISWAMAGQTVQAS